jgi:hypothetical protein
MGGDARSGAEHDSRKERCVMDVGELLARYEARGDERDFVAAKRLFERAIAEAEDARLLIGYGYLLDSHGRN